MHTLLETREIALKKVNQQIEQSQYLVAKSQKDIHSLDIDTTKMHISVMEVKQIISQVDLLA